MIISPKMAESDLNLLQAREPKRRTFEVDFRDAYGFTVRPQHVQTYGQYIHIYKEEEEERTEKWNIFLEQHAQSTEPYSFEEESREQTLPGEKDKERLLSKAKANEESASVKENKVILQSGDNHLNEDAAYKETLQGDATEVKDQVASAGESKEKLHTEAIELKEEVSSKRSKEMDAPAKFDSAGLPESQTEKPCFSHSKESERKKAVQFAEDTEKHNVKRWAKTRPSLFFIEDMMNSRVKKGKNIKNMNKSGGHIPSIKEPRSSKGESEEKGCVNEMSAYGVSQVSSFPWKEELESLVHGGVPKDLRGEVWQAFVGVQARRVERYYEDLLAQETCNHDEDSNLSAMFGKWRKQIEKISPSTKLDALQDLPRTFPGHPALNEKGRDSLRRLLLAYARYNPSVGYCQGMNFFAGLLLLLMPEENAFWALVSIIDEYFDGYYTEEMIESQVDQLVLEELMHERFPKLVNHLDYLGVQVAWFCGPWFLSIFVNMLPWESVLRIWDVLLFEGNRVMLFRTALALMELYGPALVTTNDAADAITLLQSLAGSTFDSSQLVLTACMGFLAVTDSRLRVLREKHRPAVLEVVEERKTSQNSKGLASKLYSFNQDSGSHQEESTPFQSLADGDASKLEPRFADLDELLCSLNANSEVDFLPDLQEKFDWMKVELCRSLEQKRAAVLRAEELETALMEMVMDDNRQQLTAKTERLEQERDILLQTLDDNKEHEASLLKVIMRLEQEQRIAENVRRNAEQEAVAQRRAVADLQEKYEKALASIARMEKRVVMAESMLEATLQYESSQSKTMNPRVPHDQASVEDGPGARPGLLPFAFGWPDRNKRQCEETKNNKSSPSKAPEEGSSEDK